MPEIEAMLEIWNSVSEASAKLNSTPEKINESVDKLLADRKELVKELEAMKKGRVGETVDELVEKAIQVRGVRVIRHLESEDMKHLVSLAKELIGKPKTVVILGSDEQGAKIVVARSPDVDLDCRPLIKDAMKRVGGSGGGKPDFSQGGGPDASKIEDALDGYWSRSRRRWRKSELSCRSLKGSRS
jgi:alanyl-tRNA synthetase